MKKLFFAAVLTLLMPTTSLAYGGSGACSWHGGVNCSAGSSITGSVICRDGWQDSTVSFNTVCSDSSSRSYCYSASDCAQLLKPYDDQIQKTQAGQAECIRGVIDTANQNMDGENKTCDESLQRMSQALQGSNVAADSAYGDSMLAPIKSQCDAERQKITSWKDQETRRCEVTYAQIIDQINIEKAKIIQLNTPQNPFSDQTSSMNNPSGSQRQTSTCPADAHKLNGQCYCDSGYQPNFFRSACVPITCLPNASIVNGQCACNAGYVLKNNQCITYTQDCTATFGDNVVGSAANQPNVSSCGCSAGYRWNDTKTACIANTPAPATQCAGGATLNIFGSCVCPDGYFLDTGLNICSKIITETPPAVISQPVASNFFIGIPKNKIDLFNCSIIGKKANHLYYLRGSKVIKQMTYVGKECFATEQDAKNKKYRKAKWQ